MPTTVEDDVWADLLQLFQTMREAGWYAKIIIRTPDKSKVVYEITENK